MELTRRGMVGVTATATASVLALGLSGTAAAQEQTTTVELVDFAFDPGTEEPLEIPTGTTVVFVWDTGHHNLEVLSQPDGSEWEGHEEIEQSGFEHEHTFDVDGEYEFECTPHADLGMDGMIIVDPNAEMPTEEDDGAANDFLVSAVMLAGGAGAFLFLSVVGYLIPDREDRPGSAYLVAFLGVILALAFVLLVVVRLILAG